MSQTLVLKCLKDLGGKARVCEVQRELVRQGYFDSQVMLQGLVSDRLRKLAKTGEVHKLLSGEYEVVEAQKVKSE